MKRRELYWYVYNHKKQYTDEELVQAIQEGKISKNELITNKDLRVWMPLKETIYRYYLPEEQEISLIENIGENNEVIQ